MVWLFCRHPEYLSCEVRTCRQRRGFEVVTYRTSKPVRIEWYSTEHEVERRWKDLQRQLRLDGWTLGRGSAVS
jgi:hypothetical protein